MLADVYLQAVNSERVQRESAWWNIVQLEGAACNLVELFDFIYRVEDFEAVHCFDVINAAF
jgi:hypothetical protein